MSAFPDWQKFAVKQKRDATGCIPTGFEILLRAAGAGGICFDTFQDDFDLDQDGGTPRNHFVSVADEVKKKYPNVAFTCKAFEKGKGDAKLEFVEKMISNQRPVVVSIAQRPEGGWHIMPVVDSNSDTLVLLHHVDDNGTPQVETIAKTEFIDRHNNWKGGEEICYLERC